MDDAETPLDTYLREIDRTPLLSAREEFDLAARVAQGDREARDHLTRANLRLVVRMARAFVGKGLCLEDLIAEGNCGLLRAVEGFDGSKGNRFSTYASHWINQSIKRALMNTARQVRVPVQMLELVAKWRSASNELTAKHGRPPTPAAIARKLKIPAYRIEAILAAIVALGEKAGTAELTNEQLHRGSAVEPIDDLMRSEARRLVKENLQAIRPKQARELLKLRFGLGEGEPMDIRRAAMTLGLSQKQAIELEAAAFEALNDLLSGL